MKVLFRQSLLAGVLFLFITSWARAAAWQPVGFGSGNGSSKFRVFVDTDSIKAFGGKVRFWLEHVFYGEQQLISGKSYIRVSIPRVVYCNDMSDSTLEALFYKTGGK